MNARSPSIRKKIVSQKAINPDVPRLTTACRDRTFVDGIQALRAIAAISIVFFHAGASISSQKYQGITGLTTWTGGLFSGVDLFFVISGFVISLPFFRGRVKPLRIYAESRLLRIYPLVFLTAGIFAISNWAMFARPLTVLKFASSFLLVPTSIDPTPIVLWTLKQELLFYSLFALVMLRPKLGLLMIALWGIGSVVAPKNTVFAGWFFHPQNVQFVFGMIAAAIFVYSPPRRFLATILAVVSFAAFTVFAYCRQQTPLDGSVYALVLGLTACGIILGIAAAQPRVPKLLLFLGQASFSIYLIHFFFVSVGNKILATKAPHLPGWVALIILSTFATLCGVAYYWVAERRFEDWRKKLTRKGSAQTVEPLIQCESIQVRNIT
jgi:peptidoglycan/LPS O-acetylase OafA/YrhL